MSMLLRRRATVFGLALLLSLAGALVVILRVASSAQGPPPALPVPSFAEATGPPSPAALERFGIFRRPSAAADAIPQSAPPSHAPLVRRVRTSNEALSEYASLAGHRLCITLDGKRPFLHGGPAACNSIERLDSVSQFLIVGAGGSSTPSVLAGLVPDGISHLTVTYGGGRSDVPVVDNAFHLDPAPPGPVTLSWKSSDGTAHSEGA